MSSNNDGIIGRDVEGPHYAPFFDRMARGGDCRTILPSLLPNTSRDSARAHLGLAFSLAGNQHEPYLVLLPARVHCCPMLATGIQHAPRLGLVSARVRL
jgi:hypothetical protein